ncbi:hypothetical protein GCM10010243_50050 [Streptomyces matensis]|nr:hypothetical protein GCM10010243_50050 [Streptomyces matensis]
MRAASLVPTGAGRARPVSIRPATGLAARNDDATGLAGGRRKSSHSRGGLAPVTVVPAGPALGGRAEPDGPGGPAAGRWPCRAGASRGAAGLGPCRVARRSIASGP